MSTAHDVWVSPPIGNATGTRPRSDDRDLAELDVSVRLYNVLRRNNIYTVGDLRERVDRGLLYGWQLGKVMRNEAVELLLRA